MVSDTTGVKRRLSQQWSRLFKVIMSKCQSYFSDDALVLKNAPCSTFKNKSLSDTVFFLWTVVL